MLLDFKGSKNHNSIKSDFLKDFLPDFRDKPYMETRKIVD